MLCAQHRTEYGQEGKRGVVLHTAKSTKSIAKYHNEMCMVSNILTLAQAISTALGACYSESLHSAKYSSLTFAFRKNEGVSKTPPSLHLCRMKHFAILPHNPMKAILRVMTDGTDEATHVCDIYSCVA